MANKPQLALEKLINALENHLEIASSDLPLEDLEAAELALRDAFFTYDDVLFTAYEVELPFDMITDDDDLDEDDDDLDDVVLLDDEDDEDDEDEEDNDEDYFLIDEDDEDDDED
ncbi:hypothetical protein BSR29_04180 [Boudabousia liubingyangii]|uniref:DNA primase n=1 Tax=Boudabousia liubingyangii TaxID=1921764 RepID=A0A1Q5PNB7_9ACTO|nr:hypothetical protein [Boudabousia liubingyangii]OKL47614.1 hypothetical protein BSR28_03750 [Boudabousia liubingyangii]OKL49038.1 hypothetical protein BSR29_04180 [Boudabousia liubingyangii]